MMRILCILILATSTAVAQPMTPVAPQPMTAAQHVDAGQRAFDKGRYAEAYAHYEAAFNRESTPANALRMLIAAGYAVDLSSASSKLDIWLVKKRDDAKRLGDAENSWNMVETVSKALRYAVVQKEKQVADLEKRVADLEKELLNERGVVRSIRAGYEKQISDLKINFENQLDRLRATAKADAGGGFGPSMNTGGKLAP